MMVTLLQRCCCFMLMLMVLGIAPTMAFMKIGREVQNLKTSSDKDNWILQQLKREALEAEQNLRLLTDDDSHHLLWNQRKSSFPTSWYLKRARLPLSMGLERNTHGKPWERKTRTEETDKRSEVEMNDKRADRLMEIVKALLRDRVIADDYSNSRRRQILTDALLEKLRHANEKRTTEFRQRNE